MKHVASWLSIAILATGSALAGAAPGDELYARPGQLAGADHTRLSLYCLGTGSPAVVFDSGFEDWAPVWTLVQPAVSKWTRACSYDRAGAGFSDAGSMPRTSARIADELHGALHNAGVTGPYILVGHAFGGDNVRTFAQRYLKDVAGLVLVEADVPADRGDAGTIAYLRKCRDAIAAGTPLPPLSTPPGQPPRTCAQQFFRGLPEPTWSPQLNDQLLAIARSKTALYDASISEMEQMPADKDYLEQHQQSLGSRPLRVLSTGHHGIHTFDPARRLTPDEQKYQNGVRLEQEKWLALSSDARQLKADKSGEYLPFDQPDLVIEAIRDVYTRVKQPGGR
jgi:pimeloyl-ACP methyl ester carboxylesterase